MPTAIITTCMGRLDHLRKSLPTWVEHTPLPIYVVDYCCPDRCGERVSEYAWHHQLEHRITPLWFPPEKVQRHQGRPLFNKAKAWNHALGVVQQSSVLLLDADTQLHSGFWEAWGKFEDTHSLVYVVPKVETRCLTGVLLAMRCWIRRAGGFDEEMQGWGSEDLDLRLRMFLGGSLPAIGMPAQGLISAIEHDDELRSRNYLEKDLRHSNHYNKGRMLENLRKFLGWSDEEALEALQRPEVLSLLVTG